MFGKSPSFAYKSCFLVQDFQHPVPSKQHCRGVAGGFQKYVVFLTQCLSTGFIHRLQHPLALLCSAFPFLLSGTMKGSAMDWLHLALEPFTAFALPLAICHPCPGFR